jgi:hypothetical protein
MSDSVPEGFFVTGGDVDRVSVSLRVAGDDLNPASVTQLLRVEPTFAARKGEQRASGGGLVRQPTGVWSIEISESREWILEDAIAALLDRLPADPAVWKLLAERYQIDVFCGIFVDGWNRGFDLSPALLGRLAERFLKLDVDIYCNGDRPV